ncbi:unnamed protein product [Arabis nemorensis]|uniref:Uncharacterized protein n=1 Tax=Arabis nemorensis TaxID=586526 RepID=A0A565BSI1_9BRAS|nr:unnamed protein product [Arabis nemorensis]
MAKNVGSPFFTPLVSCIADSCLIPSVFPSKAGIIHGDPFSSMHTELKAGIGMAETCLMKSIPKTTLKSSMGMTEKSTGPYQLPSRIPTFRAFPLTGCALAFTVFILPSPFDQLTPSLTASSMAMKLCVAPVSTITWVGLSFIRASTYMSPLLIGLTTGLACRACSNCSDPILLGGSSGVSVSRFSIIVDKDPIFGQSFIACGPLHTKHPPFGTKDFFLASKSSRRAPFSKFFELGDLVLSRLAPTFDSALVLLFRGFGRSRGAEINQ